MIKKNSKIFVAGHNGLVGKAVVEIFKKKGYKNILVIDRKKLDLRNEKKVSLFFKKNKPQFLVICAARVGGILENNNFPLEFLVDNIDIEKNLLLATKKFNLKRTIFLGSSCIYPKTNKIPIKEEYLMNGKLEPTNEAYALSKIVGIKLSAILHDHYKKDIVCLMPTNVYGINDNFEISSSHVVPGLITKFINAINKDQDIRIWGSGKPVREFIHVDDLANAILFSLKVSKMKLNKVNKNKLPLFNVGSGESISIKDLAYLIAKIVKFKNKIIFDTKYPDGTLNKNLDSSKIKRINWKRKINFKNGLSKIIQARLKKYILKNN